MPVPLSPVDVTLNTDAWIVNDCDVAEVNPVDVATSVYPTPALLMERSLNVATPLTALRVSVPLSVPLDGLAPSAMVTGDAALVTVLPAAS